MEEFKPQPRPQVQRFFDAMTDKKPVIKAKKLHPFVQVLSDALDEYSKTKNRTDIAKENIISMTMVGKLIKGESVPTKLTPKLRAAIKFLGYDDEAAWIGKKVKIIPVTPPDPAVMLKELLKTDRAKTVVDMISAVYRDEFSSIDG